MTANEQKLDRLIEDLKTELRQSLSYLAYSFDKISQKQLQTREIQDPEVLETFEALVSRFSRTTDIFMSKYLRALAEKDDPAFRGSLRDWVNYAEKRGTIDSAANWMAIRELRNKISHEYAAKDLAQIFEQVLTNVPTVLKIGSHLK